MIYLFTIIDVRNKCTEGKIKWSAHAAARIQQRGISRNDVISSIENGEIIEEYPDYWLNPACLIFGYAVDNKILHVVVGLDEFVHIVTAYYPDSGTFEADMKTRKER